MKCKQDVPTITLSYKTLYQIKRLTVKTESKVLMGFLLIGFFITSTSYFFVNFTKYHMVKTGQNHGKHLRITQSIKSNNMEVIEESFAYTFLRKENRKNEFLDWEKSL
jgi:hypothetical protein